MRPGNSIVSKTGCRATVTVAPFAPFTARTKKAVAAEAEVLAVFQEPEARAVEVRFAS